MDDLIVRWVVGRLTDQVDPEGRENVKPEIETAQMTVDGVLRRLRKTLLEEDVAAVTIQIGEYDRVSDATRDQVQTH